MDRSFKLNYASLAGSPAGSRMALNHIEPFYYYSVFFGEGTAHFPTFATVLAGNYDHSIIFPYLHLK
jgi:hypothetical protein